MAGSTSGINDFVNKDPCGRTALLRLFHASFSAYSPVDFIDHTYQQASRLIRQFQASRHRRCGVNRQLAYGLLSVSVYKFLHKGGAAPLILLIQTLRLFKLLIHQHFPVLDRE